MPKWNWLGVFAMGNSSGHNNTMTIPPGKGPHQVGCSDLMVGHTIHVSVHFNCVYMNNCMCVIITFKKYIFLQGYVLETVLSLPSIRESSAARLGPVQRVFQRPRRLYEDEQSTE